MLPQAAAIKQQMAHQQSWRGWRRWARPGRRQSCTRARCRGHAPRRRARLAVCSGLFHMHQASRFPAACQTTPGGHQPASAPQPVSPLKSAGQLAAAGWAGGGRAPMRAWAGRVGRGASAPCAHARRPKKSTHLQRRGRKLRCSELRSKRSQAFAAAGDGRGRDGAQRRAPRLQVGVAGIPSLSGRGGSTAACHQQGRRATCSSVV